MKTTIESNKGPQGELILSGELNIYGADQLLAVLKDHLLSSPRLELNLNQVKACDPIAVQILISAEKSAKAAGKDFRIVATSESFRSTCQALGFNVSPTEIQSLTQP